MNELLEEESNKEKYSFKIILVGNSGVGKTSILNKYIKNIFDDNYTCTIGVDFSLKNIEFSNKTVNLRIWDTAGQEKYNSTTKNYFQGSDACFLVFDLTSIKSFNSLQERYNIVCNCCDKNIKNNFVVLGNKCDLEEREVNEDIINEYISDKNIKYFETSAKTGYNIDECFKYITERLIEQYDHNNNNGIKGNLCNKNRNIVKENKDNNNIQEKSNKCC